MTLLHFAAQNSDVEVVEIVVNREAGVFIEASDGRIALCIVLEQRYPLISEYLINHEASIVVK